MEYIFIVNNYAGKGKVKEKLELMLDEFKSKISYSIYETTIPQDATNYVKKYCEDFQDKTVCFVACGGDGTLNEVASGLAGSNNKYLAVIPLGSGNDFIKYYDDKNFSSINALLNGKPQKIDLVKVNDRYFINMGHCGFEAMVASVANKVKLKGKKHAYTKGIIAATLKGRFNKIDVFADGEKISKKSVLIFNFANGKFAGGNYKCSPRAINNDGLIDVVLVHSMPLLRFLTCIKKYKTGKHLDCEKLKDKVVYRQVKHLEIVSKKQIELSIDGEIITGNHFSVDIMPNEINFIEPEEENV